MTIDEAKKMIQIEKSCINGHCDRNCGKCDIAQDIDDLSSAYDIAIQALEKQMPKKITIFKIISIMAVLCAIERLYPKSIMFGVVENFLIIAIDAARD